MTADARMVKDRPQLRCGQVQEIYRLAQIDFLLMAIFISKDHQVIGMAGKVLFSAFGRAPLEDEIRRDEFDNDLRMQQAAVLLVLQ